MSDASIATIKLLEGRSESLKRERSSWVPQCKEISNLILPRSGRFFLEDRNRGENRHNNILDSTATRALRTLGAGMMAGATSPARPWMRLGIADKDLAKHPSVKHWLSQVTQLMLAIFAKSNTYRSLHGMYEEMGAFGTASSVVMSDYRNVIHHYPMTFGEYCIATDWRGHVNTLYREFQKTVQEVVAEFGKENVSTGVRAAYERGSLDQWVTIIHAIEPRSDRDPKKKNAANMAWKSVYFEAGNHGGRYLRESGFKRFPAIVPRWHVSGGDIYGSSPAMDALGDVKQLQHQQLRKAQAIDYQTKPPLQVPSSMKLVDTMPGGISYVDMNSQSARIQSAFDVNLRLDYLLDDINDVRYRINSAFYADLFLMMANSDDTRKTATEIAERHEEKMLVLGPVIERIHNEELEPLVEITFINMLEAGIIPPPPRELQGVELNVEFISMLAQAQRAIQTNSVDRYINVIGTLGAIKPNALDKLDEDVIADRYADMLGIDPDMVVAGERLALIRNARAQAMQQQQDAEMARQEAETVQRLASAQTDKPSALNAIGMFSGYNS